MVSHQQKLRNTPNGVLAYAKGCKEMNTRERLEQWQRDAPARAAVNVARRKRRGRFGKLADVTVGASALVLLVVLALAAVALVVFVGYWIVTSADVGIDL